MIPYGSEAGWAAAVFDHYQAVVGAIGAKLQASATRSRKHDAIGGSTFNFDIWQGHPFEDEVLGLLKELRERAHTLRSRVDNYITTLHPQTENPKRVVLYVGQNVIEDEPDAAPWEPT